MSKLDLGEVADLVEHHAENEDLYPLGEWVYPEIFLELIWIDDELLVQIEVLQSYDKYEQLEDGESAAEAAGKVGDLGEVVVNQLEESLSTSVELPLTKEATNTSMARGKYYIERLSVDR